MASAKKTTFAIQVGLHAICIGFFICLGHLCKVKAEGPLNNMYGITTFAGIMEMGLCHFLSLISYFLAGFLVFWLLLHVIVKYPQATND